MDCSHDVNIETFLPIGVLRVYAKPAGTGHNNIEAIKFITRVLHPRFEGRTIGNVHRSSSSRDTVCDQLLDRASHPSRVTRTNADVATFLGKFLCDSTTDSPGTACHDCLQPFKAQIHNVLLFGAGGVTGPGSITLWLAQVLWRMNTFPGVIVTQPDCLGPTQRRSGQLVARAISR
jgi:hypothetical protein